MTGKATWFKRLSIGTDTTGKVYAVSQGADTLSEALNQEITYFIRDKRIPAQIIITKED